MPSSARCLRRASGRTCSATRWRGSCSRPRTSSRSRRRRSELVARPAQGVPSALPRRRSLVRAVEEPDPVRRPDHRVDDREGDGRPARAAARLGGHLQPPHEPHAARDRRDDPVRPRHPRDRVPHEGRRSGRRPRTTRASTPACPPTPIANPGLASIRAAANPARGVDYLYYVRKPKSLSHYFTASESDFLRKVCQYGYACD